MKQITLLMLGILFCLPAFSQWDTEENGLLTPLITNANQFSSPCSDISEGLHFEYLLDGNCATFWHANWHSGYTGPTPYYIDIEFVDPVKDFINVSIGRRSNSSTCQITKLGVSASVDGKTWVQVGEADYPYTKVGEYLSSKPIYLDQPYKHLRLTRLATSDGNSTWHLGELQIFTVEPDLGKKCLLEQVLSKYDEYYWGNIEFNLGTKFGQYSNYDAADAFLQELENIYDLLEAGNVGNYSVEQVASMCNNVEKNYKAVMDSEVLFSMPTGYYRIISNLKYYTEEDTGETDLDGNPVTSKVYVDKALYSTLDGWAWWGTKDDTDCRQLWKLEMVGDDVKMVNAGTEYQISGMKGEGMAMAAVDTLMRFDYCGSEDGKDIFYIRFASVPKTNDVYLHQWYHGKGTGTGHTLCTWKGTFNMGEPYVSDKGTSEWYLEPVSDEEAQQLINAFAMVKNHDLLVLSYKEQLKKAGEILDVAKDLRNVYQSDTENPRITATSQFSTLWNEPKEGSLENLLDGDPTTYWHSRYSTSKATAPHQVSLDVAFDEPFTGIYQLYVLRRANEGNNHIVKMSLYGSNDAEALNDPLDTKWNLICSSISTPWVSGQVEQYSQPFEVTVPYTYWRFYEEETQGTTQSSNYTGCSHYATFQIYASKKTRTSQYDYLGEDAVQLDELVNAGKAKSDADITLNDYNALQKAYDAIAARLVDPSELRNTMAANSKRGDMIVLGTAPMQWLDDSSGKALADVLAEAAAYDEKGAYTQQESDTLVARIKAAADNILASVNQPDVNKWYRIHLGSEEMYDKYGWSKDKAISEENNINILGYYVVPSGYDNDNLCSISLSPDEIIEGTGLGILPIEDLKDPNVAMFRFIPLENGKYAIQNRASNLYMQHGRLNTDGFSMQLYPGAVEVQAVGYGQALFNFSTIDGVTWDKNRLNCWRDHQTIIVYNDSPYGTNSAFCIEEAEEIDPEEYNGIERMMTPGRIYAMCYPSSISVAEGVLYQSMGTYVNNEGKNILALNIIEESKPGVPFIYVLESSLAYDATAKQRDIFYLKGQEIALEAKEENGLVGVYSRTFLEKGNVAFEDNLIKTIEDNNYSVGQNEAYLKVGESIADADASYDLELEIGGEPINWDAIQQVVQTVSHKGDAYNLQGQLVGKGVTLGTIRSLGRGTYILNGVKIHVK